MGANAPATMNISTFLSSSLFALGLAGAAHAATFSFTPTNLTSLDHTEAVTWGITWDAIPANQVITGATLKLNKIWDWKVETDKVFIHLLDDPYTGVRTYVDNTNDNVISDYFSGQGIYLTDWTDPFGGDRTKAANVVYAFTSSQLATLTSYITDSNGTRADFGFGLDADCHYYFDSITFEITTGLRPSNGPTVPDTGSSVILLGTSLVSLVALRRRFAGR